VAIGAISSQRDAKALDDERLDAGLAERGDAVRLELRQASAALADCFTDALSRRLSATTALARFSAAAFSLSALIVALCASDRAQVMAPFPSHNELWEPGTVRRRFFFAASASSPC